MKNSIKILALLFAMLIFMSSCDIFASPDSSDTSSTYDNTDIYDSSDTFGTSDVQDTSDHFSETTESAETTENTENAESGDCVHKDTDDDGRCDICTSSVMVAIDLYAINDLHGKLVDTDSNGGVDELTTYLKTMCEKNDNVILLSSGDMWQGSSESNLTKGMIITEWMNHLGFVSMTLGNHEYDWGEEYIEINDEIAEFPFLAINVFDRETNKRAEYCDASTVIECDGIEIGIIGAIGDCYSSISGDKSGAFYFKTGNELTKLVKEEAQRLRAEGVDFIVYSIHDGGERAGAYISSDKLSPYYDISLSDGYIDLVFEGHTHQKYTSMDEYGVYHLQNGGENKGISHAEIGINTVTNTSMVWSAEYISSSIYSNLDDDPIVEELLEKYEDEISVANKVLGQSGKRRDSDEIEELVAKLYYETGIERWGENYNIVLGGGFLKTRDPYDLQSGTVTYGDIQAILPFDNQIVLCSISGRDLKDKFFETENRDYHIYYETYGSEIKSSIELDETYYIIVDSYTSSYAWNRLTVIEMYDPNVYARDLVAQYIESGAWK